jgi:hypothetical protein
MSWTCNTLIPGNRGQIDAQYPIAFFTQSQRSDGREGLRHRIHLRFELPKKSLNFEFAL